jgi:hypothetical protein
MMALSGALIAIGIALIFIVGIVVHVLRQREKSQWLSHEVERELQALEPGADTALVGAWDLRKRIREHLASPASFFTVALGMLGMILLHGLLALTIVRVNLLLLSLPIVRANLLLTWNPSTWSGFLSVLWQVHASIIGITFVVIVLLVEALGGKLSREGFFRLYIRKSYILPIAFAGLTLTGSIGVARLLVNRNDLAQSWLEALAFSSLMIFGLFLMATAWLYWKTLDLLRSSSIRQARIQLVEQAVIKTVQQEIRRRLGHNILNRVCQELELDYIPFPYAREDLAPIQASQFGVVLDINLHKLAQFAQMLTHRVQTAPDRDRTFRGFLLSGMGSFLGPGNSVLARVYPEDQTDHTVRLLQSTYKVGRPIERSEEPLVSELKALKDEARAALRDRQPNAFDQVLDFYFNLFDRILRIRHAYGMPRTEVATFPLPAMHSHLLWILERDLYDIIEFAISTQDRDLISSAIYFPVRIALLALEADEQQLFAQFVGFMPRIYQLVAREKENRVRAYIIDQCWRHLRDFVDNDLARRLESDLTPLDELSRLGRYLTARIRTLNELLKAAVDARDQESFGQFGTALDQALQHYRLEHAVADHHRLKFRLQYENLSEEERQQLEQRLTRYQTLVGIREQAQQIHQAIWFGISGWLVREFTKGRIGQPVFAAMLEQARGHFHDLGGLSSTYSAVRREKTELGWISWVAFELPDRQFHAIDTDSWMRMFYCVQGLRLTPEDIGGEGTPVAPDREPEYTLDYLRATCQRLQEERDLWRGIVSDQDLERVDNFLELHRRAVVIERRVADSTADQPGQVAGFPTRVPGGLAQ